MANILLYLVAPYDDAPKVAGWHATLASAGCTCVDTWADAAAGLDAGGFDAATVAPDLTTIDASAVATAEEAQVQTAHMLVVNARSGVSSHDEMISIARYAYDSCIPILWVGPQTLSTYRPMVKQVATLQAALTYLTALSTSMQTTLTSSGATLISVRKAIQDTIMPPIVAPGVAPSKVAPALIAPKLAAKHEQAEDGVPPMVLGTGATLLAAAVGWTIGRRATVGGK